jgi:hypothetical protein
VDFAKILEQHPLLTTQVRPYDTACIAGKKKKKRKVYETHIDKSLSLFSSFFFMHIKEGCKI